MDVCLFPRNKAMEHKRGKLTISWGMPPASQNDKMLEVARICAIPVLTLHRLFRTTRPPGRQSRRPKALETIPRRKIQYRDSFFEEMDTTAILARHPQCCVVDEFPHTQRSRSERTSAGRMWKFCGLPGSMF